MKEIEAHPLAAACGLYCRACTVYIASREDRKRLSLLAARLGQTEEELYCEGCRSERRSTYCTSCSLISCARERGYAFCSECAELPCEPFARFQAEMPHRAEIIQDLLRISEVGVECWMKEAAERYACPSCGTTNSAYDLKCRDCGHDPGSAFAEEHREAVLRRLSQLRG